MSSPSQKAAQTIHQIKHDLTAEQRLQGWQQARLQQGLSGEFALSTAGQRRGNRRANPLDCGYVRAVNAALLGKPKVQAAFSIRPNRVQ